MKVFVLYNNKTPAMPCTPKRARLMLNAGKAAVYRMVPFTIILKHRAEGDAQPIEIKFDPGSKTTGIALVTNDTVVFSANLEHRGEAIKLKLAARRSLRAGRRARKTRYRQARFDNRTRPKEWLPPSIQSRVDNVVSWAKKLIARAPISSIAIEQVRFDMQIIDNPHIQGVGYQQGTLHGYEIREYLLAKFNQTCAYCDAENVPLEIEHVHPRSRGGSNRISNLTLACRPCNQAKDNRDIAEFVTDPIRLTKIQAQIKRPLKDAAAVNTTRLAIVEVLKTFNLPISWWSGGRTKMNRIAQGYSKDHWIDAACVGASGAHVTIPHAMRPLHIRAMGRGHRQTLRTDKFGFPRNECPKLSKRRETFSAGDLIQATIARGKKIGTFTATISAANRKRFDLLTDAGTIGTTAKNLTLIQRADGYRYAA